MTRQTTPRQERIDRQASLWLIRIEEDGLDPTGRRAFDAWLSEDPRHAAAYEDMRLTWNDIPELGPGLTGLDGLPGVAPLHERRGRGGRPALAFGAAAAAAAAAVVIAVLPASGLLTGESYRTGLSEMRIVSLADGSSVTLGPRSAISVRYTAGERRIRLARGEAFFDVVHNPSRPFVVEAGPSVVRDVGTKFDIDMARATVRVAVTEGMVQISRSGAAPGATLSFVAAGHRADLARAPARGDMDTAKVVELPAQSGGAWREGRLVFDDVRLADVVADLNRYYGPGVRLADGAIGDLRVTASFKTSEVPAFMGALSATLPVQASEADGGRFLVKPRGAD